ncbi:MAG TPA: FAD-dependent oxidoreductase [Steroidobacteraceae bacterium]|jgi:3-phenylpropionate/trans-cinnamate dioxygenase ferredoxin reductase subunit|nr:FAD-dependent oxidoreductase [Steroidobacteraceae bacterium]
MSEDFAKRIVIVGAGQAAAQAVETLRKRGHTGPITLVGDESMLPYQRPPLSKKFLAGTFERDRLPFRHAAHYLEHAIDVRLGFPAVSVDRARQRVEIADGSAVEYDRLLLATGCHPRLLELPGAELAGVHYLRTFADVDRLRAELAPGRRAVIIGGGYIGLEVAATCREAGLEVTVVEAADRVMGRVVSPVVSAFYEAEHARHGVKIHCNARVHSLVGADAEPGSAGEHAAAVGKQRVAAVRLSDGRDLPADFVLVAIGIVATDALARDAGLECDQGILVDEFCRTSDGHIWAAGDCARYPSLHFGLRVRLESVDNAFEQGTSAALNMLGIVTAHDKVPWFWSDQFDLKMVIVGLSAGHDETIVRGDPSSRGFTVCYLKNGELIAAETINHTKDQMAARKMIPARARPDRHRLADASVAMKDAV